MVFKMCSDMESWIEMAKHQNSTNAPATIIWHPDNCIEVYCPTETTQSISINTAPAEAYPIRNYAQILLASHRYL